MYAYAIQSMFYVYGLFMGKEARWPVQAGRTYWTSNKPSYQLRVVKLVFGTCTVAHQPAWTTAPILSSVPTWTESKPLTGELRQKYVIVNPKCACLDFEPILKRYYPSRILQYRI